LQLHSGQMLAHYRLIEPLGRGGMGEVWRAADTTLDREVAIKLLPADLATDTDRLARFEREAKVLASLNHPGIAQIYGFHREGPVHFLAMELVPGEDLGARLARGSLPVEEALETARQVAEALEEAHEHHVVHRDLKPANIVLAAGGGAKVLDFGLAKVQPAGVTSSSGDLSLSPTVTSLGTEAGIILGTAAYMSPEQARGKGFDRRTDIWSFGCVLYEALTGRHLFRGETVSDTIALILQAPLDWSALPPETPPRVLELLRRCLERDPRRRLRDIGEARVALEAALAGEEPAPPASMPGAPASPQWIALRAAALVGAGLLLGALASAWLAPRPPAVGSPMRVSVETPEGVLPSTGALSPDGRAVVFLSEAGRGDGPAVPSRVFVRSLDRTGAESVPGTDGAVAFAISPDGRWLAFYAPTRPGSSDLQLRKVPLDGSAPPLPLADWEETWSEGLRWIAPDRLLTSGRDPLRLLWVAADGTGVQETVPVDLSDTVPQLRIEDALPGGTHVLATSYSWEETGYHDQTYVVNGATGEARKLLEVATSPRWSPTGHLLFTRNETLMAQGLDPGTLQLRGGAVALADGLRVRAGEAGAEFALSSGVLLYQSGGRIGSRRRIVHVDPEGRVTPWSEDRLSLVGSLVVSPDGEHLAITVMNRDSLLYEVWISETARPRLRRFVAMEKLDCNEPHWHPDGRLVLSCEGSTEEAGIYIASLDRSEPPRRVWDATDTGPFADLKQVLPDGRQVLVQVPGAQGPAFLLVPIDGAGEPRPLSVDGARELRVSPDGRAVAYITADSGRDEVHVAPFADGKIGVSTLAVAAPARWIWWTETGAKGTYRLGYGRSLSDPVNAVRVDTTALSVSDPGPWVDFTAILPYLTEFALDPDGGLLGLQLDEQDMGNRRFDLVLGFDTELRERVP
jgi:serine/threonine-protein kinase